MPGRSRLTRGYLPIPARWDQCVQSHAVVLIERIMLTFGNTRRRRGNWAVPRQVLVRKGILPFLRPQATNGTGLAVGAAYLLERSPPPVDVS